MSVHPDPTPFGHWAYGRSYRHLDTIDRNAAPLPLNSPQAHTPPGSAKLPLGIRGSFGTIPRVLARLHSGLLQGIDASPCEVEIDINDKDIATRRVVGLPDAAVHESLERVEAALLNSGYAFPAGRTLINLAPADVRKEGPAYDLPIAVGLLINAGVIDLNRLEGIDPQRFIIAGELALDGRVRPIRGAIALAAMARDQGMQGIILPHANAREAAIVQDIEVLGVATLAQLVGICNGQLPPEFEPPPDVAGLLATATPPVDFAEVRGQEAVKRAIVVAAAGSHNLLMIGPAGSGKTMMAKALPGVLPPLTSNEAIELTRIYSSAGKLDEGQGLVATRPVRTPHHTSSSASIVGGGIVPKPGEISLAHHGVLFLDELPEFPRQVLETLRQPLEDHVVTIARARATLKFPASFMLIAAMNPTPKGSKDPGEAGQRSMDRYLSRLSGPLLDRIDLHVEAPPVPFAKLRSEQSGASTAELREQVLAARGRSSRRQGPDTPNARLRGKQLDELAPMTTRASAILGQALTELGLSARAYDKIRRVARTIADLTGEDVLEVAHIAEAISYRLLDRNR